MAELQKKVYRVSTPKDGEVLIYAKSSTAAIAGVREHLRQTETWAAELATGTELVEAGRAGATILQYDEPADEGQAGLPL